MLLKRTPYRAPRRQQPTEARGYTGLISVLVKARPGMFRGDRVFQGGSSVLFSIIDWKAGIGRVNLLVQNLDKPGMIGFIGTHPGQVSGEYRQHASQPHTGADKAIAIIRVDDEAPEEALQALRGHPRHLVGTAGECCEPQRRLPSAGLPWLLLSIAAATGCRSHITSWFFSKQIPQRSHGRWALRRDFPGGSRTPARLPRFLGRSFAEAEALAPSVISRTCTVMG